MRHFENLTLIDLDLNHVPVGFSAYADPGSSSSGGGLRPYLPLAFFLSLVMTALTVMLAPEFGQDLLLFLLFWLACAAGFGFLLHRHARSFVDMPKLRSAAQ